MSINHNTHWTIERGEDALDISVDYTYCAGRPAHYGSLTYPGHPADPPEVELTRVCLMADENLRDATEFELTDEEQMRLELWLRENPPEPDYD